MAHLDQKQIQLMQFVGYTGSPIPAVPASTQPAKAVVTWPLGGGYMVVGGIRLHEATERTPRPSNNSIIKANLYSFRGLSTFTLALHSAIFNNLRLVC